MRLQSLLSLALLALLPACAPSIGDNAPEQVGGDADAVKQCAEGATVRGVDVSYYQGNIDWNAAHGSGIAFAIARVSDGVGFKDPKFVQNWQGMRDAGVVRGLYQFFRPKQDPIAQADLAIALLDEAGGLQSGDLPLMLDIEVNDGVAPGTILARAQAWLQHVQE
ncbi:MAG: GH25 family lysozyme, partial [Minicystis sp.]